MTRFPVMPAALKQAIVDGQKPDRFYGTEKNLRASRKKSAAQTAQRWRVVNLLKRLEAQ